MKKIITAGFEIILIVAAVFAFAYLMAGSSGLVEKLKKPMISFASAQEGFQCCEKLINGSVCQDIVFESDCGFGLHQYTDCDATSTCARGCCIDDNVGTYDKKVPKMLCSGRWEDDENCNIPGGDFGCCVIGSRAYYTTQQNCVYRTEREGNGAVLNWQDDKSEMQCSALALFQEEGACVLGNGCQFTTVQECIGLTGSSNNFYENYLCTTDELNTGCEKTTMTTCVEAKDGVYFLDSCGNPANIYDADKVNDDLYWSAVVGVADSCNSNDENGNADSKDCGNCNRFKGGICEPAAGSGVNPDEGDYYCADTSCMFMGEKYKNGESWCVYDGKIDDGDDVVGSRHWKYVCNRGEIQIEPCADYRNEICIQSNTVSLSVDGEENEIDFRNSACVANNWRECIDLNTEEGGVEKCSETLNCRVEEVNIDKYFKFNACVPRYPGGFHLTNENAQKAAERICGAATQTCTVVYEQDWDGDCEAKINEDCLEIEFTEKMNDFCRKIGDCGLEVNIEGKYNEGNPSYRVNEAPRLNSRIIQKLIDLANPVPGQYAEVETEAYKEYLEAAGLMDIGEPDLEGEEDIDLGSVGMGIAGVGAAAYWATTPVSMSVAIAGKSILPGLGLGNSAWGAAFGGAAISAGIGFIAGAMIADYLGLNPVGSMLMAVGVGLVGAGVSFLWTAGLSSAWTPVGWVLIIVGVILSILSFLFGWGDCDNVEVEFTCKPWQPPPGADDCYKCNENLLKPCSEYRCESLGAGCEFINKGMEEEMCDGAEDNGAYPVIEPNLDIRNDDILYDDISANGFRITDLNGGCVAAYDVLLFGLMTDEPAQCKFDLEQKDFADMDYDLGSSAYTYNHTTAFVLPDPSHGQSQGIDWTGDLTLFIKCMDRFGHETPLFYEINMCVSEADDVTPPLIRGVNPANGSLVSYGSTSKDVEIYTNELAECRWDLTDVIYDSMANSFECSDALASPSSILGYLCNSTLPVSSFYNNYYIKCKDQPWLEAEGKGSERNANIESYVYVLRKPVNEISIVKIKPDEDYEVNTRISTVTLKVETAGGGDYHSCKFSFSSYDDMLDFNDFDFDNIHEQVFNQMTPGSKRIYIECSDETGGSVRDETRFRVVYDSSSPQVARIFQRGTTMTIITTEPADCVYSTYADLECGFNFNNGNSAGGGIEHIISVARGRKYYIKCKDEYDNEPSSCSIIARPYDVE